MPVIPQGGGSGGETAEERKRRLQAEAAGRGPGPGSSSTANNIATIQRNGGDTLPTRIVWQLAGLQDTPDKIKKASILIARRLDVKPDYLFGTTHWDKLTDPLHGGPMRLSTAQRMTANFSPAIVAAMLGQQSVQPADRSTFQGITRGGATGGPGAQTVADQVRKLPPGRIANFARVVSAVYRDEGFSVFEGIGIAASLAGQKGLSLQKFRQNLGAIHGWASQPGAQDPRQVAERPRTGKPGVKTQASHFTWREQLGYAAAATMEGLVWKDNRDVVLYVGRGTAVVDAAANEADLSPTDYAKFTNSYSRPDFGLWKNAKISELTKAGLPIPSDEELLFQYKANPELHPNTTNINTLAYQPGAQAEFMVNGQAKALVGDMNDKIAALSDQIIADQSAFSRSFIGHQLHNTGELLKKPLQRVYEGIYNVAGVAALGYRELQALAPGGSTFGEAYDNSVYAWGYARHQLELGKGPGAFFAETYHLPSYVGAGLDFYFAWELDPLVIAGKYSQVWKAARIEPGLAKIDHPGTLQRLATTVTGVNKMTAEERAGASGLAKALIHFQDDVAASRRLDWWSRIDKLSSSKLSRSLGESVFVGEGSNNALYKTMDTLKSNLEARTSLDAVYMSAAATEMRARFTSLTEEAWGEWQNVMKAHFVGYGPAGSVAEHAVASKMGVTSLYQKAAVDATQELGFASKTYLPQESGLLVPEATAKDLIQKSIDQNVTDVRSFMAGHPGFRQEIPTAALPVPGLGLKTFVSARSPEILQGSSIGRRTERLFSYTPGSRLVLGDNPTGKIELFARSSGQLDETAIRGFEKEMADILIAGDRVADKTKNLIERITTANFEARMAKHAWDPELKTYLYDSIMEPARASTRRDVAFGVRHSSVDSPEGAMLVDDAVSKPLFESQLQHQFVLPDLAKMNTQVDEAVGAIRRMRDATYRAMKKSLPEIGDKATVAAKIEHAMGNVLRAERRLFKNLVVPRPAYTSRIVVLDEGLGRTAVTMSNLDHIGSMAYDWKGAGPIRDILGAGPVRRKLGDAVEKSGLFDERVTVGADHVMFHMPGRQYANEPLAVGRFNTVDNLDSITQNAKEYQKGLVAMDSYGLVEGTNAAHPAIWKNNLINQFANDMGGQKALQAVIDGKTLAETERIMLDFAHTEGFVKLTRMGWQPSEFGKYAEIQADMAHGYTMGSKEIAQLALNRDGDTLQKVLTAVPREARPTIHGPLISTVNEGTGPGPAAQLGDWAYKVFVRMPEEALNRQPYYKGWKQFAEKSMYRSMGAEGIEKLTPELRHAVDIASRDFALGQVRRVMFDFANQSRLTELMHYVFPFPQPFFEGYQAWGHIAMQHPDSIVHFKQLFEQGVKSNIIQKDQNGDYVLPWYGVNEVLRWAHILPEGMSFSTRLSSLNLLTSSVVPTWKEGTLGKVFGGVGVPVPGLDPIISQGLMSTLFKNSTNDSAVAYFFQYGANAQFTPRWMQRVVGSIIPGMTDENTLASTTEDFMRTYHLEGTDKNPDGTPMSEKELIARAQADARKLILVRGIAGALAAGPPTARFPFQDLIDEYHGYLNDSNSPSEARLKIIAAHPEVPNIAWVTIGKTEWTPDAFGRQTPRLPASEFVAKLAAQPGFGTFVKSDPAWFGLLLIGQNPGATEHFDLPYYYRQLASTTRYKSPHAWELDGEAAQAWPAYMAWKENLYDPYVAFLEHGGQLSVREGKHLEVTEGKGGISTYTGSGALELRAMQEDQLFLLAKQYPTWAADVLKVDKGVYSFKSGTGTAPPPEALITSARKIAALPGFQDVPGIKALNEYLDGRDAIQLEMRKFHINDIETAKAEDLGLTERYEKLKKDVLSRYPDFEPFLFNYFDGDLGAGQTTSVTQQIANDVRKNHPGLWESYNRFDKKSQTLMDEARIYSLGEWERNSGYSKLREYQNNFYENHPEVVKLWWAENADQTSHIRDLATRPVVFMSNFDLEKLGLKVTPAVSKKLGDIAEYTVDLQRYKYHHPDWSASDAYHALNVWVAKGVKKDANFAAAVKAHNEWGFALEHSPYLAHVDEGGKAGYLSLTQQPGPAGEAWRSVLDAAHKIQKVVDAKGMHGTTYDSSENKVLYRKWQLKLRSFVLKVQSDTPQFKTQWEDLQNRNNTDILTVLMPEDYFKLGGLK